MANDVHLTFAGRLGTDVDLKELPGGQQVASFRVASTPRRVKDGAWADGPTTWHTVKAWNRLARHAADSLSSGDPVIVHGRLVADQWTAPTGETMSRYVVVASSLGHDLTHGTSAFTRGGPAPVPATTPAPSATEDAPSTPDAA